MCVDEEEDGEVQDSFLISLWCSEAGKKKRVMKVPKGTSDYQATWIVDQDEETGDVDEESSEDDDDMMDDDNMMDDDEDNNSQVLTWHQRTCGAELHFFE